MTDLTTTIAPKSDQLNADDLIGGPRTIRITKVALTSAPDQPVAIHFEGDNGKPYLACKSMRRVLVQVWGGDGNAYIGRSLTIYRDPEVVFGGMKVGGIRISHMSHLERPVTMALTASKASRKPFTVQPLKVADRAAPPPSTTTREAAGEATQPAAGGADITQPDDDFDALDWAASFTRGLAQIETGFEVEQAWKAAKANGYVVKLKAVSEAMAKQLAAAVNERFAALAGG